MRGRMVLALALLLGLVAPLWAQDGALERLELRVSDTGPGARVRVDRGRSDGVEVGDRVVLRPRSGGERTGAVTRVDDRSAMVELADGQAPPPVGTRGEVMLPASRRAAAQPAPREPV